MSNAGIKLNNGSRMPSIGLGTWNITGKEAIEAVETALQAGYRLIDTATLYGNETEIGKAVAKSGLKRDELYITTKLWNSDHKRAEHAFNESLRKLGLEYVDLYLIHWPVKERLGSRKILEKIHSSGKAKSIGVSNFTVEHLEELLMVASVVPAVNQVEFSPFLYQKELLEYCRKKKIQLQAYSPLTHGKRLGNKTIKSIAEEKGKSTSQILLRWHLQHGTVPIPKATSEQHIKENIDVFDFELSKKEMEMLNGLDCDYRTCWNPTRIEL